MSWSVLKDKVGKAAPLLGSLLAGRAGEAAGTIIASALGVEATPNAVAAALQDPEAYTQVREIELRSRVELERMAAAVTVADIQADTSRVVAVNETMRAEAKSEAWYQKGWRPYWGFAAGTAFFVVSVFVCYLAYKAVIGGNPEALTMIPQLITSMFTLFSIPGAILGVAAWHRGKQKRIVAGEHSSTP